MKRPWWYYAGHIAMCIGWFVLQGWTWAIAYIFIWFIWFMFGSYLRESVD